jgi:hypothetical protein
VVGVPVDVSAYFEEAVNPAVVLEPGGYYTVRYYNRRGSLCILPLAAKEEGAAVEEAEGVFDRPFRTLTWACVVDGCAPIVVAVAEGDEEE